MGGGGNPNGLQMEKELDGYYSAAPGTVYAGYEYQAVPWSAQVVAYGFGTLYYDQSQAEGVTTIDAAIASVFAADHRFAGRRGGILRRAPGRSPRRYEHWRLVTTTVYRHRTRPISASSSSEIRTGPTGGFSIGCPDSTFLRRSGLTFDGPTPVTEYQTLDVSWEYDPISDFPTQPFNILADLNALAAFLTRHSFYYDADLTDTSSYVADVTVGSTRYLTLRRDHLPLLEPVYKWVGILAPVLDAIEPALRSVIDRAYDRTVSPAVSTPLHCGGPQCGGFGGTRTGGARFGGTQCSCRKAADEDKASDPLSFSWSECGTETRSCARAWRCPPGCLRSIAIHVRAQVHCCAGGTVA